MNEKDLKPGTIVYAWDEGFMDTSVKTYFSKLCRSKFGVNYTRNEAVRGAYLEIYDNVATPEEYQKLLNEPKDKDLVWAWNKGHKFRRLCGFYDARHDCLFTVISGERNGLNFDHYEVTPKDKWPSWAHELYEGLEE